MATEKGDFSCINNLAQEELAIADLEIEKLGIEIEELREMLYCVAIQKGIRSPKTIQASQALDTKINKYYLIN